MVLGLRMNRAEEDLVIAMAKEAGVKKIYKSFIDEKTNGMHTLLRKMVYPNKNLQAV